MLKRWLVQGGVHDAHVAVRELPHVAPEEDWLAGFELFDNGGFKIGNRSVDICNTLNSMLFEWLHTALLTEHGPAAPDISELIDRI